MAIDFFAAAFFWPLIFVTLRLLVAEFLLKPLGPGQRGIAGIGVRRLIHGYVATKLQGMLIP
jgi:hypothetical protein